MSQSAPGAGSGYSIPSTAGGGTSLFDLPLTVANVTDGTWTLFDPDNLVKSVSFSGGFITVTWNALTGSANYNWTAGTICRSPRWYKTLTIDGNNVTNDALTVFTSRIEQGLDVADFNNECIVGVANDASSVTLNIIDGSGGLANRVGSGSPAYGTWQVNGSSALANSTNDFGMTTVMRGFRAVGSGIYLNINSDVSPAEVKNSGSRNSNANVAAASTINQQVIIGIGIRSNGDDISQDDQQKFKASYAAIVYGGLV
tara:strand:+ start:1299 stop:2069 length:771 start_codon:yes stop_codon:yes gene_type:complete